MRALKKLTLAAALMVSVLAGCGGGTTTASGSALSGTAAVGAPIASGTITISCAGGNPTVPATTTTDAVGAWSLTLTGQTLPCAVQVSGGTINGVTNTTPYHSIASAVGTVNVTPMTDLIVANATGSTAPSTWFAAVTPTALAGITPAAMTASLTQIRTALNLPALNNVNPLTAAFTPAAGNPVDDILTALQLAITNTGSSLATLRTAAANPTFTPPVGFSAAMNTQHGNTSSGGAAAPAAPTGVTATATSSSQINLAWSAVSGALSYNVYAATATGVALTTTNKKNTTLINGLTYSGTGLTAATTYYIKVTALNAAGESVGSSEATATTQAAATTGGGSASTANVPTGFVARTNPSGALTLAPAAVVWTGSMFVALELNQNFHSTTATLFSWTSTDGISWTRSTTNLPNSMGALTAANGKAFMMGGSGYASGTAIAIYSSTDGVTWTTASVPTAGSANSGAALGVKYLNNRYFAALDVNACNAMTSSDGTAWATVNLNSIALPTGYVRTTNNNYCSEAFYVGGNYVIAGGLVYSQTGSGSSTVFTYKGLSYTTTDGTTWTANTFNLPSTINSVLQGGRVSTAMQVGTNVVLPAVRTDTTVSGTQVLSNYQAGVSSDGSTFAFSTHSSTPDTSMISNMFGVPSLDLPSGRVGYKSVTAATRTYGYTTDGYTFTAAPDLMFKGLNQAAYSPTLRRLVVIRQDANATTFANTGVTIGTLDFPTTSGTATSTATGMTVAPAANGLISFPNTVPTVRISGTDRTLTYKKASTTDDGFDYFDFGHAVVSGETYLSIDLRVGNAITINGSPATNFLSHTLFCTLIPAPTPSNTALCSTKGIVFDKTAGSVALTNTPLTRSVIVNGSFSFTPF